MRAQRALLLLLVALAARSAAGVELIVEGYVVARRLHRFI
jgi:hypothetical protein